MPNENQTQIPEGCYALSPEQINELSTINANLDAARQALNTAYAYYESRVAALNTAQAQLWAKLFAQLGLDSTKSYRVISTGEGAYLEEHEPKRTPELIQEVGRRYLNARTEGWHNGIKWALTEIENRLRPIVTDDPPPANPHKVGTLQFFAWQEGYDSGYAWQQRRVNVGAPEATQKESYAAEVRSVEELVSTKHRASQAPPGRATVRARPLALPQAEAIADMVAAEQEWVPRPMVRDDGPMEERQG